MKAMAYPETFRETKIFDVLGYSPSQIKQMIDVTPRPASLTVEAIVSPQGDGKFEIIKVHAKNVKYYNLTIDHADFSFPKVSIDMNLLEKEILLFRSATVVEIETYVSEADILKVFDLFAKARSLSDLRLKISPKETVLNGKSRKGFWAVAFKVVGEPKLDGCKKINFDCRQLVLNGLPLPRAAVKALFNSINPVFDAAKTWLNLDLDKIEIDQGFVRSFGTIRAPVKTGKSE